MDGWLGFNGILSTQVAAISCLRSWVELRLTWYWLWRRHAPDVGQTCTGHDRSQTTPTHTTLWYAVGRLTRW